jgi:hypothetical protein
MVHHVSPEPLRIFCRLFAVYDDVSKKISAQHLLTNPSTHPFLASITIFRKDQKKVDKLNAQIPYHEGRGNKDEVGKIKEQIDAIWEKAREAQFA